MSATMILLLGKQNVKMQSMHKFSLESENNQDQACEANLQNYATVLRVIENRNVPEKQIKA